MKRGKGYDQLILNYLEQQYEQDRPADCPPSWLDLLPSEGRIISRVSTKNGQHLVHKLLVAQSDPCCFARVSARAYRTRRIAEVVAQYQHSFCDGVSPADRTSSREQPDLCNN